MKQRTCSFLTLLLCQSMLAQPGTGTVTGGSDAEALGSGGQRITYEHPSVRRIQLSTLKPFGLQQLRIDELNVLWPWLSIDWATGIVQQGNEGYRERALFLGVGRHLGPGMHLTIRCVVYRRRTGGRNLSRWVPYADLNLVYEPRDGFTVGCRLVNPTGSRLQQNPDVRLYQCVCLGMAYQCHPMVTFWLEGNKEPGRSGTIQTGLRFQPYPVLGFRCGFSAHPLQPSIGLEGSLRRIQYAVSWQLHGKLGASSAVTLTYLIP